MSRKQFLRCMRSLILSLTVAFTALFQGCSHLKEDDFSNFCMNLFRQELSSNTLSLHYLLENPTSFDIHNPEINLGSCSPDRLKEQKEHLIEWKKKLDSFSKTDLSLSSSLTYEAMKDYVNAEINLSEYPYYEDPLLPSGGEAAQLPLLFAQFPLHNASDLSDYLNLLGQTDRYLMELFDFEKERAQKGLFMSDELLQQVLSFFESFLSKDEDHFLISSFEERVDEIELNHSLKESFSKENRRIILDIVLPAYRKLAANLSSLMGSGRNELGLCYYDEGKSYYEALVHYYTGCSDPMDLLAERLEEDRFRTFANIANLIESNPELSEQTEQFCLDHRKESDMIHTLRDAIEDDFPIAPTVSCSISHINPDMKEYLAPAFYITAPIDNYTSNTIYINSASDYSDIRFFTTLAHEGFPGHLYQTVMSYYYGMDPVRSILNFPGYIEGWATYVELLSYHYAGLPENVANLLMYQQAAMLNLYASSDLGIHYYGWDENDLFNFWNNYGLSDHGAILEIKELILSDPGNYLKYYVGCLNFLDLRTDIQEKEADSFSLKRFHESLLRIGPASFDTLQKYIGVQNLTEQNQ